MTMQHGIKEDGKDSVHFQAPCTKVVGKDAT
jgi:hypothetical protein